MEQRQGWNSPLTAKQLVAILATGALVLAIALIVMHGARRIDRDQQALDCAMNAPIGWDCERFPTGYPR